MWISAGVVRIAFHRARTSAPTEPIVAPLTAAVAYRTGSEACWTAAATRPARPRQATANAGRMTRACP